MPSPLYRHHQKETENRSTSTSQERLVARSSPLTVSQIKKSARLMEVGLQYRYGHFATCQCTLGSGDLENYKTTYASAARRQPGTHRCSKMPVFLSDNERIVAVPDKQRRKGSGLEESLLTSEQKRRKRNDRRYKKSRHRNPAGQNRMLMGNVGLKSSVPFQHNK